MRISLLYIASSVVALAAAQEKANPFTLPPGFMITAGQPTTITWDPTTQGTVSIRLREGASSNLEEGTVVASRIDNNGKTTITLPADTTRNSDYALQIVSDSNPATDLSSSDHARHHDQRHWCNYVGRFIHNRRIDPDHDVYQHRFVNPKRKYKKYLRLDFTQRYCRFHWCFDYDY
ncbi:MAG: hypothetical protein Q9207_004544 [Kuettlingeria erythrocarpa]